MSRYEREFWGKGIPLLAGIDEAGRGPLAGPVVAAAVILPHNFFLPDLNDSKKLSPQTREKVFSHIQEEARAIGIGIVSEVSIDQINILQATYLAMRQAVVKLQISPDYLLVDGTTIPGLNNLQLALIKGDSLSISIAAASIMAKVTRDRLMIEQDKHFPQYGFAQHKGYGTKNHLRALDQYGVSPLHRRSFGPVKERLNNKQGTKAQRHKGTKLKN